MNINMNIIRLLLIGGLIYFAMMQKKESTRNMILIVTGLLAVCMLSKEGFTVSINPGSNNVQSNDNEVQGSLDNLFRDDFSGDNEKRLSQMPDTDGSRGDPLPYTIRLKTEYRDNINDINSVSELANIFECEHNDSRGNWVEAYPRASSLDISLIGESFNFLGGIIQTPVSILDFITCDSSQRESTTPPPPPSPPPEPSPPPPPPPPPPPATPPPPAPPPCPEPSPCPPAPSCFAPDLNSCTNSDDVKEILNEKENEICSRIEGDEWVFDSEDNSCCDCKAFFWNSCSETAQARC